MSAAPGAPLAASAEPLPPGWPGLPADPPLAGVRRLASRVATLCWVEICKIRHDRTELYTRAVQPALWLLIFGETFTRIHAIAVPNGIPYLDFLAPGIWPSPRCSSRSSTGSRSSGNATPGCWPS